MCGLNETEPGFKKVRFQPCPDPENRVGKAEMVYDSASGEYRCGWEKTDSGYVYNLTVPFNCEAEVILPGGTRQTVGAGSYSFTEIICCLFRAGSRLEFSDRRPLLSVWRDNLFFSPGKWLK